MGKANEFENILNECLERYLKRGRCRGVPGTAIPNMPPNSNRC